MGRFVVVAVVAKRRASDAASGVTIALIVGVGVCVVDGLPHDDGAPTPRGRIGRRGSECTAASSEEQRTGEDGTAVAEPAGGERPPHTLRFAGKRPARSWFGQARQLEISCVD